MGSVNLRHLTRLYGELAGFLTCEELAIAVEKALHMRDAPKVEAVKDVVVPCRRRHVVEIASRLDGRPDNGRSSISSITDAIAHLAASSIALHSSQSGAVLRNPNGRITNCPHLVSTCGASSRGLRLTAQAQ
jgi:hypothetical protein